MSQPPERRRSRTQAPRGKWTPSTFYENLRGLVFTILNEEVVEPDYVPDANHYPVDYWFEGKEGRSVFLYGVPGRDKARLTNVAGTAVASLEAEDDLRRKLECLAA